MSKPTVKIAVIGAGSYVFGPGILHDAIVEHRLAGAEIALIDLNREMVDLMAVIGRRMARETGVALTVSAHTDRTQALDGADFVVCSAARELQRRFATDVEIIRRLAPGHLITEFGGVQGISYSFRQMALIEEIVADMKRLAPGAWLLDSANPLPRVCQLAHELGVKTAGFCANSMVGYHQIGKLMLGLNADYPWAAARERYEAVLAGMNHFTWMLRLNDRVTGDDITAEFLGRQRASGALARSQTGLLLEETGYWGPNGDAHIRDFLAPCRYSKSLEETSHGNAEDREQRLKRLHDTAAGTEPWGWLVAHRAWEKPVDLIAAMAGGPACDMHSLNLVNNGQIPNLPHGVFVETPVRMTAQWPQPRILPLPDPVLGYSRSAAEVTDTMVRAYRERSLSLVERTVDLDPTILDKRAGMAALNECLRAHADVLPLCR